MKDEMTGIDFVELREKVIKTFGKHYYSKINYTDFLVYLNYLSAAEVKILVDSALRAGFEAGKKETEEKSKFVPLKFKLKQDQSIEDIDSLEGLSIKLYDCFGFVNQDVANLIKEGVYSGYKKGKRETVEKIFAELDKLVIPCESETRYINLSSESSYDDIKSHFVGKPKKVSK